MKKSLILVGMLAIGYANAQQGNVGINTEEPKATLEITPEKNNLNGTTNEGILIPRLTKARVVAIADANLVEGTKVYVTDEVLEADQKFIGTGKGFYYYNGTKWVKMLDTDTDTNTDLWAQRDNNGLTETYLIPADDDGNQYLYYPNGSLLNLGGITREDTKWGWNSTTNFGYAHGEIPNAVMISSDALPTNNTLGFNRFNFNQNFSLIKNEHASTGNNAGNKRYMGQLFRLASDQNLTSKINEVISLGIDNDMYAANEYGDIIGLSSSTWFGNAFAPSKATNNIAGRFIARTRNLGSADNTIGVKIEVDNGNNAKEITGQMIHITSNMPVNSEYPSITMNEFNALRTYTRLRPNTIVGNARGAFIHTLTQKDTESRNVIGVDSYNRIEEGAKIDTFTGIVSNIIAEEPNNTIGDVYGIRFMHNTHANFQPKHMYGLHIADVKKASELNYSIYTGAGNVRFGDLKGKGDRPVYADADGVLKTGEATNVKLATNNNVECTAENTGSMNFGEVTINGQNTEAFGFCMKNSAGEYRWYYIYGGAGITTGAGAFGSGL